jgi:dehydration protein DpgD
MDLKTVKYEVADRVATITLNRPECGNALNEQMHHELAWCWAEVNRDDDVWAAVIRGAGNDFCVGEDVQEIAEAYGNGTLVERWKLDEAWQRKNAGHAPTYGWPEPTQGIPGKPLVAVVHGRCHGTGVLFAAFADFTIAVDDANFALPEVSLGTAPVLQVLTLARTVVRAPVLQLALLGKHGSWTADRARQLGLVVEMVPQSELEEKIAHILDLLVVRSAALSVRAARTGWWGSFPWGQSEGFNMHYPFMVEVRVVSEDAKEGPRAFAEKRRPVWKAK